MKLRKRNRTKDNTSKKKKDDKYYINKINHLLNQIKLNDYSVSDIPIAIIQYFTIKNFRPLAQNEIIKYVSNINMLPSFDKSINLHDDIISALKNNKIFEVNKKKYELNLEKCLNYLNTYQEKFRTTNSDSKYDVSPSILTFPMVENDIVYLNSESNHLNMSFILDEDNILDNSFTFGEQSQIKAGHKNRFTMNMNMNNIKGENSENKNNSIINTEELENKALEKYIPEFDFVFDENKNFKILTKVASEFFTIYKKINLNEKNVIQLDESLKKVNSIITDLDTKIEPFNKLSSSFNEEKNELFNANSVILRQIKLMQIIAENDFLSKELYIKEKEVLMFYENVFKKLLNKLQEDFNEIKKLEKKINTIILNLKIILNSISDEFVLQLNENYATFYNLIKDIAKNKSMPINVNMNETLKLFYSYIVEFEKLYAKVEEKENEKKPEK